MICHQYKCIFVHVPKSGGQSIETVFLNLLGLDWRTRDPLLLRENPIPELGPRRLAHLKASEYVRYKYISDEIFHSYFKFAFVRNPWDRMVSFYKYMKLYHQVSFTTFVEMACQQELRKFESWLDWFVAPQSDFLCDNNGNLMVDFVGRFEWFQEDFNYVCNRINLPLMKLPHINVSSHAHAPTPGANRSIFSLMERLKYYWKHHRCHPFPTFESNLEYYDEQTEKNVAAFYHKDIEMFGYRFDNNEMVSPKYGKNKPV